MTTSLPFPVEITGISNQTRQWLALLAHTHKTHNGQSWSPAQWMLDNGLDFEYSPLPPKVRMREPKRCYWNSLELASRSKGRYVYMEGHAARFIITEHAWCYDRETGLIVDTTWDQGTGYVGVPIKTAYARKQLKSGRASVWDWEGGFPIMTGKVAREQWYEAINHEGKG